MGKKVERYRVRKQDMLMNGKPLVYEEL